jgi:ribosomal protein uS3
LDRRRKLQIAHRLGLREFEIGTCQLTSSPTDGVFYAELNEFFQRELAEEGYSGVEVRVTPTVTDIIIRATHTQEVLGEQGRRIRELTSLIQKRFKFPENSVSLYAAKVQNRGLSAVAQCESLRYKLLNGLAVRRACYGVLRFIMESGAKGCEVVVSGKLRAARAKSMKFTVCLHHLFESCLILISRRTAS